MKKFMRMKKKAKQKEIARDRIEGLFELAEKSFKKPSLSKRYIVLARNIATRNNIRFPKKLKRKFCKNCNSFLKPGVNCRIRTKQGKLICTCLECNKSTRMPYLREKKIISS